MARINIEDCWWTDPRRSKLAKLLGSEEAADGSAIKAWRVAQEFWGKGQQLVPRKVWETLEAGSKLIEANLAEIKDGYVYVSGSSQYLDWIREKREAGRVGGLKSAKMRLEKHGDNQPKPAKTPKQTRSKLKQIQPSGSGSYSGSSSSSDSNSDSDSEDLQIPKKANAFIVRYCENFKFKYGSNPIIKGKESGIAKRLAQDLSEEKINLYLDAYFQMPDSYVIKAKHPMALLESKFNEVTVFAHSGKFTTMKQARQVDDAVNTQNILEMIDRGEI